MREAVSAVRWRRAHLQRAQRESGPGLRVAFGSDGTHFIRSSESPSLGSDSYGTTFPTREFVEREVTHALPGNVVRFRDITFWDAQDAVVVERPG